MNGPLDAVDLMAPFLLASASLLSILPLRP